MKPETQNYYVWRSDMRLVSTIGSSSAIAAAHAYAIREQVPYNVALRVVPVSDVRSCGFRVWSSDTK